MRYKRTIGIFAAASLVVTASVHAQTVVEPLNRPQDFGRQQQGSDRQFGTGRSFRDFDSHRYDSRSYASPSYDRWQGFQQGRSGRTGTRQGGTGGGRSETGPSSGMSDGGSAGGGSSGGGSPR